MRRPPLAVEPAPAPPRPALRLVPPPRPRPRAPFLAVCLLLIGALVALLVTTQVFVSQNAFQLEESSRRVDELERTRMVLRLEAAELSAPERVVEEARRLGLRRPEDAEVLRVGAS